MANFASNVRYLIALFLLATVFFIGESRLISKIALSDDNLTEPDKTAQEKSQLPAGKFVYYINDAFNFSPDMYYRLSFQSKSDKDAKVAISLTTALDDVKKVGSLEIHKDDQDINREIIFFADKQYTDLVFEKTGDDDNANINIGDIRIARLSVSDERELLRLEPTVRGGIDQDIIVQKQEEYSYHFSQLRMHGVALGQIFKSEIDYLTGVTLSVDSVNDKSDDKTKYRLEIRRAEFDGEAAEISPVTLASLSFSSADLERFRQNDGNYRFPIFASLEKGRYYFVGIDTSKAGEGSYLILRGTSDETGYQDGIVAVKTPTQAYTQPGSLYFILYGAQFKMIQGKKMFPGTRIEDLGKGEGLFSYQPENQTADLISIYSRTDDVNFCDNKEIVCGKSAGGQSYFSYKFSTFHPFKKIRVSGKQADNSWDKVKMEYSPDGSAWNEVAAVDDNDAIQSFNDEISFSRPYDQIYIKISPASQGSKDNRYGLDDFKVEADLIRK